MYIKQNWYDKQYLSKKIYFIYQSRKSRDYVYEIWQYKLLSIQKLFERKIQKTGWCIKRINVINQ